MDEPGTNPLIVILLFLARCLVPLLLLLGVSALLRRWGLIRDQEPPSPPSGDGPNHGQATDANSA